MLPEWIVSEHLQALLWRILTVKRTIEVLPSQDEATALVSSLCKGLVSTSFSIDRAAGRQDVHAIVWLNSTVAVVVMRAWC